LPGVLPEEAWALTLLEKASVLVQPGYFFDMIFEPCAVLSLITAPDIFAEGILAIRALVLSHA
jgi:hypothetical protein